MKKIEALHGQLPNPDADEGADASDLYSPNDASDDLPLTSASLNGNTNICGEELHRGTVDGAQHSNPSLDAFSPGISMNAAHFAVNSPPQVSWPTEMPTLGVLPRGSGPVTVDERQLLTTFLESLHRRLPFCDYLGLLETTKSGYTNSASSRDATSTMQWFRLQMACAIGAKVRQLTGSLQPLHSESYISRALEAEGHLDDKDPVQMTERLLWHIMYKLRSSFTSDVWYSTGLAMRSAIDAGMHRKDHYQDLLPAEADVRRHLFWSVYIIERSVAWQLKRPVSISDYDIDVELPFPGTYPTSLDGDDGVDLDHGSSRPLDLRVFTAIIHLSRINSQAHSRLHRTVMAPGAQGYVGSLIKKIRQLEACLADCSVLDHEFLQLHIETAVMKMTEPFLSADTLSDDLTAACLEAAGGVCKMFKRQRLERRLGYSFTMVNNVFTAGLTICYIIFRNPRLWTPARANELRVCSSALFAAAARNSAVDKYCDVLETIIEAVTEHVSQDESRAASSPSEREQDQFMRPPSVQAVFDRLARTIEDKGFEFPSQSYPRFRSNPAPSIDANWMTDWSLADDLLDISSLDASIWDALTPVDPDIGLAV